MTDRERCAGAMFFVRPIAGATAPLKRKIQIGADSKAGYPVTID
jgi:hypothetical protein